MTPIIEDAILGTDLDAKNYYLVNLGGLSPLPGNVVAGDDPRNTDARAPLDGSVTNASVAAGAAIDQSKLALNGNLPASWLGFAVGKAAPGNLSEYIGNKGMPDGYAALDAGGHVPISQLPAEVGTGTVTSVDLVMPPTFAVAGPHPITTMGVWNVTWVPVADMSWFGNKSGGSGPPHFYNDGLPTSLIPNLPASKITTGILGVARLPAATFGSGHQAGIAPDPGAGPGGATDYLGRDMAYHALPTVTGAAYEPTVPDPVLVRVVSGTNATVSISEDLTTPGTTGVDGCTFFYSTTSGSGYKEFPAVGYVTVLASDTLYAYAARPGYKNSNEVHAP